MKNDNKPEVKKPEPDGYMAGICGRCFRPRTECQKVIDSGRRCTETK